MLPLFKDIIDNSDSAKEALERILDFVTNPESHMAAAQFPKNASHEKVQEHMSDMVLADQLSTSQEDDSLTSHLKRIGEGMIANL